MAERETEAVSDEPLADDEHLLIDETTCVKLRDQVNLLEKQVEFYRDQAARGLAESENVRRRMEQEVTKVRKFGVERLVSDLVPVVDSLVRGLEGTQSDDPSVKLMRQGMELTLDILLKLLEKNGITTIDPQVGDLFDPMQHEAMSMRQDEHAESNTILQVLQKGYALHGRVIRAAMVIVVA
ncbi:MAG: nucleotide exchange factor GrpE [Gammaproteobacteria bacterium RIFCSPHIGHO2_12_FULL_40_19]|nr:MAG: nucleotide exchange factor GrpE [Gammaproteobacteria bacterium RIFCSPHIGHO2_12_FULL_40_19]